MATTFTGLRVQDTYNAILKIGDNTNLTGTAKLLSDGLGNASAVYLSTTRLGIGVTPTYQFQTSANAKIGGNLIIAGDLTVNGTTTIIDSTIIAIGDNMIEMAKGNTANTKDIGWYGKIVSTGTKYVGMAYDASTGIVTPKFNLGFGTVEPGNTFATTVTGTLVANLEGNVTGGTISGTTGTFSDDVSIAVSKKLKFGGGSHTYINEDIDDRLRFFTGGAEFMRFTEDTTNTVHLFEKTIIENQLEVDNNISGTTATFTGLVTGIAPTSDLNFATKKYVDDNTPTVTTPALSAVLAVGNTSGSNNLIIQDNDELILGSGSDFKAYHNQTNTLFRINTGDLIFNSFVTDGDIKFNLDDGGGSLTEYLRLDGGAIKTIANKNIAFIDNVKAEFGNSGDLQIYHDGSNSYIKNLSGWLNIPLTHNGMSIANADFSESVAKFLLNGACELYYDGAKKFETTNTGVSVTGGGTFTGIVETDKIFVAKGQNVSHTTSSIKISQESTTKSQIRFYGADTTTAGSLEFIGTSSDGSSGGVRVTINADGTTKFHANILADVINNSANSANIIYRSGTDTIVGGGSASQKLTIADSGNVTAQTIHYNGIVNSGSPAGDATIGRNYAYDTLELKGYGGELMIGAQNTSISINYRTCNNNTSGHTPTTWFWRAGSSTNWSDHNFGRVTSYSDMRAPIYYDSDDTTYYANLGFSSVNSSSVSLKVRQTVVIGDSSTYNQNDGGWGARLIVSDNVHARIDVAQDANSVRASWFTHTGQLYSTFGTVTSHAMYLMSHNSIRQKLENGYSKEEGSYRAPIFYDSNDTTYYLNPAGDTSINTKGAWRCASSTWDGEFAGKIQYHGNWWYMQTTNGVLVRNPSGANNVTLASNGVCTAANDWRAPQFYDSADTSYYLNPNGTSNLNVIIFNQIGIGGTPAYPLDVKGADTDNSVIARFYSNTSARGSFIIRNGSGTNPTTFIGTAGGGEQLSIGTNGTEALRLNASQKATFQGDIQAPGIYVGSTNTSFDFYNNGTSYFNGLSTFDDIIKVPSASHFIHMGDGLSTTSQIKFGSTSWNNSLGLESFYMVLRTNRNEGVKFIDSDGYTYAQFNASNNSAGAYNTILTGNLYAYALYDQNNTAYYLNPNAASTSLSTSGKWVCQGGHSSARLQLNYAHGSDAANSGTLTGWVSEPGMTYNGAGIGGNIHVNGQYYGRAYNSGYGCYVRFNKGNGSVEHWETTGNSGVSGGQGTMRWYSDRLGNSFATSSSRAPIFYDSQSTGYYLNPNDKSNLYSIKLNGFLTGTSAGCAEIGRNHAYDTMELKGYGAEFMIGAQSTQIHINYRTCNNGASGHTPTDWYWRAGSASSFANLHMGMMSAVTQARAPIYYDSDDTTYYLNPAGNTSAKLRQFVVIGDSSTYNSNDGGWGARLVVSDNVHARIDVAQDANAMRSTWYAHTGQSYSFFGTVTGHHQYLYSHNVLRQKLENGYSAESSSYRAPMFYDSDNTTYYIDPASSGTSLSMAGKGVFGGDVIAYSDKKLKTNVKRLDGTKVLKMRGVSFDRIDSNKKSSGVIAQELQEIAPELVSDNNGTLGVAYGNLTGYLIEAIKNQQKQINELTNIIDKLNK